MHTESTVRHTKCGRMRGMVVGEGGRSTGVLLYNHKNMYHIIKKLRVSDKKKVLKKFEKSETLVVLSGISVIQISLSSQCVNIFPGIVLGIWYTLLFPLFATYLADIMIQQTREAQ